jgi:hypothetical protein
VVPTHEHFPGGAPETPWSPGDQGDPALELDYAGGGAYASVDGAGTLTVVLDGGTPRELEVAAPGLVELASHPTHEEHSLRVEPGDGVLVYSLSFSPGIPG